MRLAHMLIPLALISSTASAEECGSSGNQTEMSICADNDFQKADHEMAALYAKTIDIMDRKYPELNGYPDTKTNFQKEQSAWVKFRDAACVFDTTDSEGGSEHNMDILNCQTHLTRKRSDMLKIFIACSKHSSECETSLWTGKSTSTSPPKQSAEPKP